MEVELKKRQSEMAISPEPYKVMEFSVKGRYRILQSSSTIEQENMYMYSVVVHMSQALKECKTPRLLQGVRQ